MKLTIIARTEKGAAALKQHITESTTKLNRVQRLALRTLGYVQEVVKETPLTLEIRSKPGSMFALVNTKHIIQEIDKALKQNGADILTDYDVVEE